MEQNKESVGRSVGVLLFDGSLRGETVLALGGGEIADRSEHGIVGDDGRDGIELVPADDGVAGDVAVVERDLRHAHEDLAIELAVVAPHDHLQHAVAVVTLELERLLIGRSERAPLCACLLLLRAYVMFEQVEFNVDVY